MPDNYELEKTLWATADKLPSTDRTASPQRTGSPKSSLGVIYHIYNRGNNRENLFIETRNYTYFMKLYARYIEPVVETYAYCLLRNHFHLLVRILDPQDWQSSEDCQSLKSLKSPSQAFSNLFSTYTKPSTRPTGGRAACSKNRSNGNPSRMSVISPP